MTRHPHMISLETPSLQWVSSYLQFIDELIRAGEKVWEDNNLMAGETQSAFIERLRLAEAQPLPGKIAESTYWAVKDDHVVGRISFRHELTENLKLFGGNIGYEVRPSYRQRGIAKEMLRILLEQPKVKKAGRVLLTCSPDNLPSIQTILANGGVLEKTAYVERWNRQTNYYWIEVN